MIRFINNNQFLLSENILNKLQSIPEFFHLMIFMKCFCKNGYYDLYIYSKFIGSHKLCLDKKLLNNEKYVAELLKSYVDIYPWASHYLLLENIHYLS